MSSFSFSVQTILLLSSSTLGPSSCIDLFPVLMLTMLLLLLFLVYYYVFVQIISDCRQMTCDVKKLRERLGDDSLRRIGCRIDVIEKQLELYDGLLQCLCQEDECVRGCHYAKCIHMTAFDPMPTSFSWSMYHYHRMLCGRKIRGCFRQTSSKASLAAAICASNKRNAHWCTNSDRVFSRALPEFIEAIDFQYPLHGRLMSIKPNFCCVLVSP